MNTPTETTINWKPNWLAEELERIDRMFEEIDYERYEINAELHHVYARALITYEMSKDEILEIAGNISDRVADLIVDIINR